jgi:hypothetical protein
MTLIVTKLNNAIEKGTVIPMKQYNGNIGRWAEDVLETYGFIINRGKGIDLKDLGLEVKTRLFDSTSGHTVGAMLPEDIIDNDWQAGNNIFNKVQMQYRVYYKINHLTGDNVVISSKVYNFTDEHIQKQLKDSWDYCRGYLEQNLGRNEPYIRGGGGRWAYLELQENGCYQFRITDKYMKEMESIANFNATKLFTVGE